ncbi:MAG: UvrD-helicase domain-containing protein [Microbacteriaceae bacterium]
MQSEPTTDDHVDVEIANCLGSQTPRSFFLYAGAGSGKTRSLVNAVRHGLAERGHEMALRGQQIAVITYTNAAADEISSRLAFNPLVRVSTIHSFSWDLIRDFQADIRSWVKAELSAKITELGSKSSRVGTKKEADRVLSLQRAQDRLAGIDSIRRFTYSPVGENRGREALNHSQVILLTAKLLATKPLLGQILTAGYPILFIDESQDTSKPLLEAFMRVASEREGEMVLGLFGDTMQRIYSDGKSDIAASIPPTWATPAKVINHRSPERIVKLSNRIRSNVDSHLQEARADRGKGCVRLFITKTGSDTSSIETRVIEEMASVTQDSGWVDFATSVTERGGVPGVKRLILEHSMAAQRLGFANLFTALSGLPTERTNLLDGSIAGLQVFLNQVGPLIEAHLNKDPFRVARLVRESSPLLSKETLANTSEAQGALRKTLDQAQGAVDRLTALWAEQTAPTMGEVATVLEQTGLFTLSATVRAAVLSLDPSDREGHVDDDISAWQKCLLVSFDELTQYGRYVGGYSAFATHQGVKGLEFPRVLVVISDHEAGGFLFSYEKLFGVKSASKADTDNRLAGKETSIDRTRRLMYVTCSRATQSLAIVAYTAEPDALRAFAIDNHWFEQDEVTLL